MLRRLFTSMGAPVLVSLLVSLALVSCAAPAAPPATPTKAATLAATAAPPPATPTSAAAKVAFVGVFQFVTHPALDDARKGAIKALADNGFVEGKSIKFDIQNGQADMATVTSIAQKFKDEGVDLMIAVGTQPLQSAANVTKDTHEPYVVFDTVTDPYKAGVAKSPTDKPSNITGVQALPPVEDALKLVQEIVPGANKVGIVWNPAEANSEVATKLAREAATKLGITLVEATVSKPDDVLQAAQSLVAQGIDAFFVSTDSTVVSALEAVVKVAQENKKPLIGNDPASAKRGAVAALGIDYYDQGYESGVMAAKVLKGQATPKDMPIEKAKKSFLAINLKAAETEGAKLPAAVVDRAQVKYTEITPKQ